MSDKEREMKTLIAIPCMETIPTVAVKSLLSLRIDEATEVSFSMNSLVYDARNALAQKACENGFERILWLDSDMTFDSDLMNRLSARIDEGNDFVTGLYFTRRMPIEPVIYKDVGVHIEDGKQIPVSRSYRDYPLDSIFEVKGCGFGGCMMTTKMVLDIAQKYGLPFSPILGFGEDLSFCQRATQAGYKIYCDSSIKLGHMSHCIVSEENYFAGAKP